MKGNYLGQAGRCLTREPGHDGSAIDDGVGGVAHTRLTAAVAAPAMDFSLQEHTSARVSGGYRACSARARSIGGSRYVGGNRTCSDLTRAVVTPAPHFIFTINFTQCTRMRVAQGQLQDAVKRIAVTIDRDLERVARRERDPGVDDVRDIAPAIHLPDCVKRASVVARLK